MISSYTVSIILLSIWLVAYLILRKRCSSAKIYFGVLGLMASAGVILDLNKYVYYVTQEYDAFNIFLFAILLLLVIIPWLKYDKLIKYYEYTINPEYKSAFTKILTIFVLLSTFTIIYCLPYALAASSMGADVIRNETEGGLLPTNMLTTVASAVASLAPIGLTFFFASYTSKSFKKHSYWFLLAPLAGIVHSMACAARELYIFLPITFIILFLFFKNSIPQNDLKRIKYAAGILGVGMMSIFMTFTISRFGEAGSDSFIGGTWGYLYQQPYVFDQTLQYFDNFKGFSKSLSFIGDFLGMSTTKKDAVLSIEWSFGTMYKAFYEMFGYTSLLLGSIIYLWFFNTMAKRSIRKNHPFAIVINFTLFIWFTVSGLFYFRYGANSSYFLMYLFIMIFSFVTPKNFFIRKNIK